MPELVVTEKEYQRIKKIRNHPKIKTNLSDEEYHSILAMRLKMADLREARKNIVWVNQNEYDWLQRKEIARSRENNQYMIALQKNLLEYKKLDFLKKIYEDR